MEQIVHYQRSQALKQHLESLCESGGWLTLKSLERYLLYGILPALQKYSAFCFSSQLQDDSILERGTSRTNLPAELADSISPLSDQYSLSPGSFTRLALWLGIEVYIELAPNEKARPAKEEFRRYTAIKLRERVPTKVI